jgi:phosphatidylglycerophosphate synthase
MNVRDLDDIVWDRIGDKWLVGRTAAALFAASAIASVGISVVLIRQGAFPPPLWVPMVLSGLFLISGMRQYWTKRDQGPRTARRNWFFALTFGVWFGAALYCAFVYLPQVKRGWSQS